MAADIFHRQFLARLIAGNGLMFSTMVLEHPVDFLHAGAEEHIAQEDCQLEQCLKDHAGPAPHRNNLAHKTGKEGGQECKEKQRQHDAQAGGKRHERILKFGAGVFFQPAVQLGFLRLLFLLRHRDIRRVHQVFVAAAEVFHHVKDATHKGNAVVPVGADLVISKVDCPIGAADCTADFGGSAHHDTLHEGLSSHRGTEFFSRSCFLWHSFSFVF